MSFIRFIPVGEIIQPLPITIGLSGASGTGKTFTALRIARGIAEAKKGKGAPIGFVDTENRRALHYRDAFPEMMHFDMQAVDDSGEMVGFTPERWIEVIDGAEAADVPVLVIDSFSHAWEGVGGILDLQAMELERLVQTAEERANGRYTVDASRFSEQAWIAPKRRYRRLIDRIVRAKCDMIICTRAKPVRQESKNGKATNSRDTKTRRRDIPWDPASDRDLMFEMTAMMILDPSAPGFPVYQVKCADQFKSMFDRDVQMDEELGRRMAEWANGKGDTHARKVAMDRGRAVARRGAAEFAEFWNSDEGKASRQHLRPILDELRHICSVADAKLTDIDSDDPFAGARAAETQDNADRSEVTPE